MSAAALSDQRSDIGQYSNAEKAAIVLLGLGENARGVMERLHEDELRELSGVMSSLGAVPPSVVEGVLAEFSQQLSRSGSIMGSLEETERILNKALPADRVATIMEELRGPAGRSIWDKLSNVNEKLLAGYLANEYPQTVAVVLTKVPPAFAAKVLSALPHDFAVDTIHRMLTMEPVQRDIEQKVESTMRIEFISNLNRTAKRDSHEAMAEIFNNFDRNTESRFLAQVDEKQHDSAERIRALMFVFEDLNKLDPAGVQTLMRLCDKSDLALALKGASEALRQLFMGNMSERGRKLLLDDMQSMGPVRMRDVDAAQARLVAVAKEAAARGELMLGGSGAEDELIY